MPTCQASTGTGSQMPPEVSPSQDSTHMDDLRRQIQEQAETIKALRENLSSQATAHQAEVQQASQAAAKQAAEQAVAQVLENQRLLSAQQPSDQTAEKKRQEEEQKKKEEEDSQKAAQEQKKREDAQKVADKAAQEAADKAAQEQKEREDAQKAADKAAQEAADKAAQEAADKAAQEAADKAAQEAADKAAQEAADKAAQEAADKAAQEAAETEEKQKTGLVPVVVPPTDPSASGDHRETKTKSGAEKGEDLTEKKNDEPGKGGDFPKAVPAADPEKKDPMPPPKAPAKTSNNIEAFLKPTPAAKKANPKKPPPRTVGDVGTGDPGPFA